MDARRQLLCDALERDKWEMSPLPVELNRQLDPDSGLTADENLGDGTPGSTRPPGARLEPWRAAYGPPMVVDLVGGSAAKPSVWPVAVEPGDIERQFLFEGRETVRDHD